MNGQEKRQFSQGVLYKDTYTDSNFYHIMCDNDKVIKGVLNSNIPIQDSFPYLESVMSRAGINALWVMPDTKFSQRIRKADIDRIDPLELVWYSPPLKNENDKPSGLKFYRMGEIQRFMFFPDYMELSTRDNGKWNIPFPHVLLDSLEYVRRATGQPLLWSAGRTGEELLRESHKFSKYPKIKSFNDSAYSIWYDVQRYVVDRPYWSKRKGKNGKRGLNEDDKQKKFIYGVDKEGQYLGAAASIDLGNGGYAEVGPDMYWPSPVGFWEYQLTDVSNTAFNGYDLYCPLSHGKYERWASTELLNFAKLAGIRFEVKRGVIWKDVLDKPLEKWAKHMWDSKQALKDAKVYPDTFASVNAQNAVKLEYVQMMGRFMNEYSKEYYRRDWNLQIIHQAIASQGYSILSRLRKHGIKPVMVTKDAIYIVSDEDTIQKAYPTIIDRQGQLAGFKLIGKARLSESIIEAFETERSVVKLEDMVIHAMNYYRELNG